MSERIITERHWLIIINPKSGKTKFEQQSKYIAQKLEDAGIPFYIKKTEYPGHALEISKKYARRACVNFLVVGGDGTINEVVNGIFSANIEDTSLVRLAVLPSGTGNDWARFWGINRNNHQAIKNILQNNTKIIDIGKVEYTYEKQNVERFFINSVGFGLDAEVLKLTNQYKKNIGDFSFFYIFSLIVAFLKYKTKQVKVNIDDEKQVKFPLLSMNIANGPYTGGGIKQNPLAVPFDSIFDMMMVGKLGFKDVLTLFPKLFNGKISTHPKIQTYITKEIEISSEDELSIETDGVLLDKSKTYRVSIIPQALQMIVPDDRWSKSYLL